MSWDPLGIRERDLWIVDHHVRFEHRDAGTATERVLALAGEALIFEGAQLLDVFLREVREAREAAALEILEGSSARGEKAGPHRSPE